MKKLNLILFVAVSMWAATVFTSCATAPVTEAPAEQLPPATQPPVVTPLPKKCPSLELVSETLQLANQKVTLPKKGRMVLESHLATKSDTFPGGRLFPSSNSEKILDHMNRACEHLKKLGVTNCLTVFSTQYHKAWTPPEAGKAGQGSVGNLKPTVEEEMWSGNLYWTSKTKPKPGTKFLASRGDRHVVVVMGYETGPKDPKFLGGLQGEVMWWLKANNTHGDIQLARLKDQSLTPGPVICEN